MLGANVYSVGNGVLRLTTPTGDPNHLLYAVPGYDSSIQEVLARIRILNFGTGDAPRGGIATCVDPAASPAGGIDLHIRDENLGRHIEFLDDLRAWGTEYQYLWQTNTWYWLRLRHEPNAATQGGVNDAFGKIWPADGSTAEPAAWQDVYDYTPGLSARTGYAGIVAGSSSGTSELEIDYILIKAAGLPSVTVAPAAFPLAQTAVAIVTQPQGQSVSQCQPATFSVLCSGTAPITYQWQRNGTAIPGATNSSYTTPLVQLADNGALFRVVVANVASNTTHTVISSNASLTVTPNVPPPRLVAAANNGLNQVIVTFSEPVTVASANTPGNYAITNLGVSLAILKATLADNQTNVTLVTTGQI